MNYKQQFIELMLEAGVLTFGDFTTKSGRKTPYFINTGNYKTGDQIARLGSFYATCLKESLGQEFDLLYGPAYKGIPLTITTAISLSNQYNLNLPYCFNRKEKKDHGEGGSFIGYRPQHNDRIVIVEDVITAGTSVRESLILLKSVAEVDIKAVIVSVDRMEKGSGEKTTLQELEETYGIKTIAIVNIHEIVAYLYNKEINGQVLLTDEIKKNIESYLELYGTN